jgi:uncharacterized protein (TIGR03084 family)
LEQLFSDLRVEGDELHALLEKLEPGDWARPTPFKRWTVHDVVAHLHESDRLAVLSLGSPDEFRARMAALRRGEGKLREAPFPGEPAGMLALWREFYLRMCDLFEAADPTVRLPWVGPDMGLHMFATARQMETWAHGQDVYDLLRVRRMPTDRLKNIAVIGVKTFGWTFVNRKLDVPQPAPHVRLTAPSGATWEWNEPSPSERVEGAALDFCRVVTQGRHVADTALRVSGENATRWMEVAQCFAGPPSAPPRPGERAWD